MSDVFLGLIALGVLVMAAIQVGAIVMAIRAARRVEGAIGALQQDVRPIVANLQTMSADAARATAKVAAQVDQLEKALTDVSARITQTASTVQETVLAPIREAMAIVLGLKTAFGALTALSGQRPRHAPAPHDDEPPFVG